MLAVAQVNSLNKKFGKKLNTLSVLNLRSTIKILFDWIIRGIVLRTSFSIQKP